jgi:hypothetical protein
MSSGGEIQAKQKGGAGKTPYSPCKLYYDGGRGDPVLAGHFLRTPAGSAYFVQEARPSRSREHRVHLNCLRWPESEIPEGAKVHRLVWYQRTRNRNRRQRV